MDITENGDLILKDKNGQIKNDFKLPYETDYELCYIIRELFEEGSKLIIITIKTKDNEIV